MSGKTWMDEYEPPPYWPGRTCENCRYWGLVVQGECDRIGDMVTAMVTWEGPADAFEPQPDFGCVLWEPRR